MNAMAGTGEHRINLVQGDYYVTQDPSVVLTTLLGSCVAACIRDPKAGVGGMNHFLLPGHDGPANERQADAYAVHLMELLVNGLLKQGAKRERLEAKLFGGAKSMEGLTPIGIKNARFAEQFLQNEGIRYVGGSLGGEGGRRLQYWPVSGRARQSVFSSDKLPPIVVKPVPPKPQDTGAIEFF